MNKVAGLVFSILGVLFLPPSLYADAQKHEWFGNWAMNHDGHAGTLSIVELKVDCETTLWCDMALSYTGSNRPKLAGSIVKIDDKGQHMLFEIAFPGNRQRFDAYIFSGDKQKIAGTTYWGGRTFGFYATKKFGFAIKEVPASSTSARAPTTLKELRKIAARIKKDRFLAERPNKPHFTISGASFIYYGGDRVSLGDSYGYKNHFENPYLAPLALLIQIDDLRRFIDQQPGSDALLWKPYFDTAEAIIEQNMLSAIAAGGDPRTLELRLRSFSAEIERIVQNAAPDAFARSHGLTRKRPTLITFAKHLVPVTFTLTPPGQLYVVTETSYEIANASGREIPWRDISGTSPKLGGYYWIRVVWSGDTSRDSRILVDQSNTQFTILR